MEWKLTKNELPEENVYVLVHIKNEFNNCDVKNYYAVARIEKGISEEERDKMPECPRKRRYYPGDVFGNNLVPYRWSTIGPVAFFGQEVDKWAYIDDMGSLNNVTASEALKCLKLIEDVIETKMGLGVVNGYLINIIEQALRKTQEQEKILSIIKEKNVDIIYLKDSNNVEEYNSHFGCAICKLTPEEFELLKRYFG